MLEDKKIKLSFIPEFARSKFDSDKDAVLRYAPRGLAYSAFGAVMAGRFTSSIANLLDQDNIIKYGLEFSAILLASFASSAIGALILDVYIRNPDLLYKKNDETILKEKLKNTQFINGDKIQSIFYGKYASFLPKIYHGESMHVDREGVVHQIDDGDIILEMHLTRNMHIYNNQNYQRGGQSAFLIDIFRDVPAALGNLVEDGNKKQWLSIFKGVVGSSHFARKEIVSKSMFEWSPLKISRRIELASVGQRFERIREFERAIVARLCRINKGIGAIVIPEKGEYLGRRMYISQIFVNKDGSYEIGVSETLGGPVRSQLQIGEYLNAIAKLPENDIDNIAITESINLLDRMKYSLKQYKKRVNGTGTTWISMDSLLQKHSTGSLKSIFKR